MKQLQISKLMDEYVDSELSPEGESTVDAEAVKAWVMANVKMTAGPGKRKTPRKKMKLLAAALAAVMVVLVGAGIPSIMYGLASGNLRYEETGNGRITALVHYAPLVQVEDGRLWFTPDRGERIDITDMVSEETPYIYDGSDPETNLTYYVIMGGTPEFYGYFEWIVTPDPFDDNGDVVVFGAEDGMRYNYSYAMNGPDREDDRGGGGSTGPAVYWEDALDHTWLRAGLEELGIPITKTENYTITHAE